MILFEIEFQFKNLINWFQIKIMFTRSLQFIASRYLSVLIIKRLNIYKNNLNSKINIFGYNLFNFLSIFFLEDEII